MTNRDPVKKFAELLTGAGVIDEDGVAAIRERVEHEFDEGFEFAQQSPLPDAGDVDLGVFAEDGYWEHEPPRTGGTA
jgi:pyruvate dehydrogenase E1 component alpha subunit